MKTVFNCGYWLLLNLNTASESLPAFGYRMIILCFPEKVYDTGQFLSHLYKKVGCPGMALAIHVSFPGCLTQLSSL